MIEGNTFFKQGEACVWLVTGGKGLRGELTQVVIEGGRVSGGQNGEDNGGMKEGSTL